RNFRKINSPRHIAKSIRASRTKLDLLNHARDFANERARATLIHYLLQGADKVQSGFCRKRQKIDYERKLKFDLFMTTRLCTLQPDRRISVTHDHKEPDDPKAR